MQAFVFDGEHALRYGVNEAIMLHHIIFWIDTNAANKQNFFEGRYWTYNSTTAFMEQFPFWTKDQIKRILKSLREQDVIMVGNFNKSGYDKTLWYALTDTFVQTAQSIEENSTIDGAKSRYRESGSTQPIPDNNTDNNTDRNHIVDTKMQNLQFGQPRTPSINSQKAQAQPNPPVPATPLPFASKAFADAWAELCGMKKWAKKPQSARDKALKKLARYPEWVALKSIEDAIIGDFQGIFPEKYVNQPKSTPQQPLQTEEAPRYKKTTIEELLGGKK